MVIAWDLPIVEFGSGTQVVSPLHRLLRHQRARTAGTSPATVCSTPSQWSDAIDAWQAPYVNDDSKPLWYRGALFNEMYILADGGSFWGRPVGSDPKTPHTFAFMECFDYPFYATLDVRFYGSMPLAKFWPEIDKQELRQFADTVPQDLTDKYMWQWKTQQTAIPALSRYAKPKEPFRTTSACLKKIRSSRSTSSAGRTPTTGRT